MQMNFNGLFPPNFMLHIETPHEENHQQAFHLPSNPVDLLGVGRPSVCFPGIEACEDVNLDDKLSGDSSAAGEKTRRLNVDQVRMLERSFELGSKLEPERKMQLARSLGLKPRQIAIWFQNRRARWKTKKLEKDYDALKREFDAMRSEIEALQFQNKKLQAEILALKGGATLEPINLNKETEGSCSNRSENISEINLDVSRATTTDNSMPQTYKPENMTQVLHSSLRLETQCPKIEHGVNDESFSNLFCSIDDQSAFWTWSEHHNFH